MTNHKLATGGKTTLRGAALLAALASGALTVGALTLSAPASASCASISGVKVGSGCDSTVTNYAVGLGDNTSASAKGVGSGAIAIGKNASASSDGNFNLAVASGEGASASTKGNLNLALTQGKNSTATAGYAASDTGNVAINVGDGSDVWAGTYPAPVPGLTGGSGNLAVNLFGKDSTATAIGIGNRAVNVGGENNKVDALGILNGATNLGGKGNYVGAGDALNNALQVGGNDNNVMARTDAPGTPSISKKPGLNTAFSIFGNHNEVAALKGPGAVAGNLGGSNNNTANGTAITRDKPGITVNKVKLP